MKKICLVLLGIMVFSSSINAEILKSRFKIAESEKEFDVIYYQTSDMKSIDSLINDDVAVTQSFEIVKNGLRGELRFSLFTDLGGDLQNLKIQFSMWVFMCTNNIAGFEVSPEAISTFNDSDVKSEFNGDFGCTTFIKNPKSEYSKGYKYMMVEFFYRNDQGIVMRTFLFNDINFVGVDSNGNIKEDSPLFSNYHTFKFKDN